MSNPTFVQGPIPYRAAEKLEQFRLVRLVPGDKPGSDVSVEYAQATGKVFGAVAENRDPENILSADTISVYYGPAAVKLRVAGGEAAAVLINAGDVVYAAADGKVAATGTVEVGVAAWNGEDDRVMTVLNKPGA